MFLEEVFEEGRTNIINSVLFVFYQNLCVRALLSVSECGREAAWGKKGISHYAKQGGIKTFRQCFQKYQVQWKKITENDTRGENTQLFSDTDYTSGKMHQKKKKEIWLYLVKINRNNK